MWKHLLELGKRIASLVRKSEEHDEAIKQLQQHQEEQDAKIEQLTQAIQKLAMALQHDRDVASRDRENLILRLENSLLKSGRALVPPADEPDLGQH